MRGQAAAVTVAGDGPPSAPAVSGGEPLDLAPLTGFTVAVTAARRREELGVLLERRGARVVYAPAVRLVPLDDDTELREATEACLAVPADVVVVTTGIGFRGWLSAVDGWGLAEPVLSMLRQARIFARGPKARGAIRAAGLRESWSAESEELAEIRRHLLSQPLHGRRVAIQLHGEPLPDFVDELREAGADVVELPVYRWTMPAELGPVQRLVGAIAARDVDAVTFTSAPAVHVLLATAERAGLTDAVLAAFGAGDAAADVLAACVGPVTAGPLVALGVPPVTPSRSRLGALVRELVDVLPARHPVLSVAGSALQVRGHGVVLDGVFRPLPPTSLAVLRVLTRAAGRVCSRQELCRALPGGMGNDEHAVEMAVGRLRTGLGRPGLIRTVVKRGYRLAVDEPASYP